MRGLLKETSSAYASSHDVHFHTIPHPNTDQNKKKKNCRNVCPSCFSPREASANVGEEVSTRLLLSPPILSSVGGAPTHLPHHPPHLRCSSTAASPASETITDTSVVASRAFAAPLLRAESASTFSSVFRRLRVTGLSVSAELTLFFFFFSPCRGTPTKPLTGNNSHRIGSQEMSSCPLSGEHEKKGNLKQFVWEDISFHR